MDKKKKMIFIIVILLFLPLLISEISYAFNQTVYSVQKKLKELGYEPGPLDGILGRKTKVAVKIFQQDYGLPVTGRLTKRTLKTLGLTDRVEESLLSIIKRITPSVVVVNTYNEKGKAVGQGTGFFISQEGAVITNYHVLEGASHVEVKTSEGEVYPVKEIFAEDKEGDIILLSVEISQKKVQFAMVSDLLPEVGEQVIVIGNPMGFKRTVSDGIVSAVRQIPAFGNIVQITAPISPGSSGSPVVNLKGEVVGVASFHIGKGQNLNFAIPGERVAKLVLSNKESLAKWEKRRRERAGLAEELYAKGMSFVWAEDYEKAISHFEMAVKQKPRYAKAYFQIGYCNELLRRYQKAIEAYDQAIRIKPNGIAYYNRGSAYFKKEKLDQAISDYNKAIDIDPNLAEAYNNRGVAYRSKGQFDKAISDYNKAIELDPESAVAYNNRGYVYAKKSQFDQALSNYNKAIEFNPRYAEAYYYRGIVYGKKGQYDQEISNYNKAIEFNPRYAEAYNNRGVTYREKGLYDKAISDYNKAIDIDPNLAEAYNNRGIAYGDRGQHDKAISDFITALDLNPNLAMAYNNLGVSYFFKRDYEKAWDNIYKAQKLGYKVHPRFLKDLSQASGREM